MIEELRKIWDIFAPAERRRAVRMMILIAIMALAETGGVLSIMPFLSVLAQPALIHTNRWFQLAYTTFGFHGTRSFIAALGLASIAMVLISSAYKTVTLHRMNRFIHLQRHSISSRLLARYLHQPYEFFLSHHSSTLSRNVLSEVDQLLFNLIQPLSQLIAQGAVVIAMLLVMFLYDWQIALGVIVVVGLLYASIYALVRRRLERIGRERQSSNGRRFQACSEVLSGIKDVKVTAAAKAYQDSFDRASRLYSRHLATSDTLSQSPLYMVEAVGYTGLIAIALALMAGTTNMGEVFPALGLYGFAAYRMLPSVQIMYRGFARLKFSSPALDAIHRDLQLPEVAPSTTERLLAPLRAITLHEIRYAYPAAPEHPVLDRFNLVIPAGTSIGIAGKSGAGKSTLMDILLGLLHPQVGSLSIDDTVVTAENVSAWQRAIGYVPQHIFLADASVAENIAIGVPRQDIDMQAVERAGRAAQIDGFVRSELKDGYDTFIGERGIRLSGGQRQRVGIARALYRDPPVLFMDEATSALDSETEASINAAIRALAGHKTIVIIAHRQSSLEGCDRIVHIGPMDEKEATAPRVDAPPISRSGNA